MPKSSHLLAGACVALIGGCASHPPVRISPAVTAAALEARRLDEPGLSAFLDDMHTGPVGRVWTLDQLTLAAVYFHPDLQVADAKLQTAKAAVRTARQLPNPTLDLSSQYDASPQAGVVPVPTSPWTIGATVNLLIETFGKRGDRIGQAQDLEEAARADVETAAWRLRSGVSSSLIDLWAARRREALERRTQQDQAQLAMLLERRLAVGAAASLDVARERAKRDQVELAVVAAEGQASAARARLAQSIGVPSNALTAVSLDFSEFDRAASASPTPTRLAELQQRALTSRADIQAALARYAAADAALRLELAGRIPNVTLGPSYTFDQGEHKYGLAATSIELPVFNRHEGPIAEAAARRRQAAAEFLSIQTNVLSAIETADAGLAAAAQGESRADQLETAQNSRQAMTAAQFRVGQIDRPTLLAGALELDAAKLSRADAEAARLLALGELEDALQQPLLSSGREFEQARPPPLPEMSR